MAESGSETGLNCPITSAVGDEDILGVTVTSSGGNLTSGTPPNISTEGSASQVRVKSLNYLVYLFSQKML